MSALQPSPDKRIIVTGPDLRPFHIGVGSLDTAIAHEEADVVMALYMIEEAKTGQPAIKVVSDDTVLVILALPVLALPGTNRLHQDVVLTTESCSVINANAVIKADRNSMPNRLSVHALTGCDTVFSLSGVGKATVLKKLLSFNGVMNLAVVSLQKKEITDSYLQFTAMMCNYEQL